MGTKIIRITLGILLIILAINAFGGGWYGMAGAKDIPPEWLGGSPFRSYFIPSLFLFVCVGGMCLLTALALFRNHRFGRKGAITCGILLLAWIAIQVAVIGYVSWMQPTVVIAGALILALALWLPGNPSVSGRSGETATEG